MNSYPIVKILPRREIPVLAGHPWIFSNGIDKAPSDLTPGSIVVIQDSHDQNIGIGFFNPHSSIRIRMISLNASDIIDHDFLKNRLIQLRELKCIRLPENTTGFRWVYAESDNLPGLILDQYGELLVFQIHTAGMDGLRSLLLEVLEEIGFKNIIERSDVGIRKEEGLTTFPVHIHKGNIDANIFRENNLLFIVDVLKGQKTGFFLDQRDARILIHKNAYKKKVLNLFSYTGAFSISAAKGGANKVVSVDISQEAITHCKTHFRINNIEPNLHDFVTTDAFKFIDKSSELFYDLIICDPPAFAKTAAQTKVASEAYIRINKKCLEHLHAGGQLLTSSCSGRITSTDFEKLIRSAASQAKKQIRIVKRLSQAGCHTERLIFPEGQYLKTLFVEILPWG